MKSTSKKHLIVLSVDALNKHDFDYINQLPNFKDFIENGAYVREVDSVYPSLTYTAHTSIITGTYPDKHGIFTNEIATPSVATKQPWFWFEKDIQVPTLFDYARKANLVTANVLWPVMN
jgi:predicted AlkP superfamily pyrophosphatase or phosphodiesterase